MKYTKEQIEKNRQNVVDRIEGDSIHLDMFEWIGADEHNPCGCICGIDNVNRIQESTGGTISESAKRASHVNIPVMISEFCSRLGVLEKAFDIQNHSIVLRKMYADGNHTEYAESVFDVYTAAPR